jgi:hypothetical protein
VARRLGSGLVADAGVLLDGGVAAGGAGRVRGGAVTGWGCSEQGPRICWSYLSS